MMIETWREGYRELVANHLLVELYRSVRPVFCKVPHRRPEQIGSSILIQLGEMRFLVTAKHVWDECEAGGAEILLDPGGQPSREELLVVQSELEGHDFSIALLPDGCSAESFFLTPRDIDLRDSNDASKLQWIYGWPLEGNRKLFSPYSTRCKGRQAGGCSYEGILGSCGMVGQRRFLWAFRQDTPCGPLRSEILGKTRAVGTKSQRNERRRRMVSARHVQSPHTILERGHHSVEGEYSPWHQAASRPYDALRTLPGTQGVGSGAGSIVVLRCLIPRRVDAFAASAMRGRRSTECGRRR
jgi:hypothetical protein